MNILIGSQALAMANIGFEVRNDADWDIISDEKFDGWYQSYNGSEYNEWFFVKPKEVTVTQYFRVK